MVNYGENKKKNVVFIDIRTKYGLYQDAVNVFKTTNEDKWNMAIFWVFDTPQFADKPFEVQM